MEGTRGSSAHRKRKRPTAAPNTGVASSSMPDIPGVPPSIIPLLVQALRTTSKFLAHHHKVLPPNHFINFSGQQQQSTNVYNDATATTTNREVEFDPVSLTRRAGATAAALSSSGAVVDQILHRLQESNPAHVEEQRQQQQRHDQMMQAIQSWLTALAMEVRSHPTEPSQPQPPNTNSSSLTPQPSPPSNHLSVPLACFMFVWELQWPTPGAARRSVASRRAALHVASLLLQKSSECRRYWCRGEEQPAATAAASQSLDVSIRGWIQQCLVVDTSTTTSTAADESRSSSSSSMMTWYQREAYQLLQYLLHEGYGDLYPQLHVAQRMLQQTCPQVLHLSTDSGDINNMMGETNNTNILNNSQMEWRRCRDLAMRHAHQEETVVRKLVHRAYQCIDVLAPRVDYAVLDSNLETKKSDSGANSNYQSNNNLGQQEKENSNNNSIDDGDDDDDDDIDWEEGADENDLFSNETQEDVTTVAHKESTPAVMMTHQGAVERTLALMKATGSVRGGQIEISFGNNHQNNQDEQVIEQQEQQQQEHVLLLEQTRTRLQRCIAKLQEVHMPRLSAWVEGLTHADGLVQVVTAAAASNKTGSGSGGGTASSSWVLMPFSQQERRGQVHTQLMDLKRQVASVLSSAARLAVTFTSSSSVSAAAEVATAAASPSTANATLGGNADQRQPESAALPFAASFSSAPHLISPSVSRLLHGQRRRARPSSTKATPKTKRFHRIHIQYRGGK